MTRATKVKAPLHYGLVPLHRASWRLAVLLVAVLAASVASCSSTASTVSSTPPTSSRIPKHSTIPASAFKDVTGLTSKTVRIANVSTLSFGLFTGAAIGTEAYAEYVNSSGGVNGRQIIVDSGDDEYQGSRNKQLTTAGIQNDFALVGGFSLEDSFGGAALAMNPGVPNVAVSLSEFTAQLPNSFNPAPISRGWLLGPLAYFREKYPSKVAHTGSLIADQPTAITQWQHEEAAMIHLGYKVVYDPQFSITQTDFTQNVIEMRNAGVQILFLEQAPQSYAAAVFKALEQQNFHPTVVIGASTYSEALVSSAGGAAAVDGTYLQQTQSLYLGEDASGIPAVKTFLTWVQKASPGFKPDLYTLYGWLSAELFVQALKAAGPNPSRGSVLQALHGITSFSGGNLVGVANPSAKSATRCYIIARIENGKFTRTDDPPLSGPTVGYRCNLPNYIGTG